MPVSAVTIPVMAERGTPTVYTSRGQVDGEDWQAVAAALNESMAARRIGQQELARLSGISVSTLRTVQHGASRRVQNKTLEAIAVALDWPADHLITILVTTQQQMPAEDVGGDVGGDQVAVAIARVERTLQQLSDRLASVENHLRADRQAGSDPGA